MNTVLAELGKRLAERWVTLLVLPGLLHVLALLAAVILGHHFPHGVEPLTGRIESAAAYLDGRPATTVLVLLGALLAAAAAGLLAQAVAGLVERSWTEPWARRPLRWLGDALAQRRADAWDRAHTDFLRARDAEGVAHLPGEMDDLAERRNRIGLARPVMPTRIGDRMRAVQNRVWRQYGLDLASAWPRLWLIVDDGTRQTVGAARRGFDTATTLTAWGALYAALASLCWPAAGIGTVIAVMGVRRGRRAAAVLADTVEAVVDLHHLDLARAVGLLADDEPYTSMVGRRITEQLRKGT
ncbi:hypothetical protein ACFZC7_21665 [Streptomyces massasporeus]|uniref:hypothetical protein n=1 Tax=Streptomyces massasporeus TaxID=67324 RepID=UPI0036F07E7F